MCLIYTNVRRNATLIPHVCLCVHVCLFPPESLCMRDGCVAWMDM